MYKFEGILCDSACNDRRSSAERDGGGTMDSLRLSRTKIRTSFSPCFADKKKSVSNATALPELHDADAGAVPSKSDAAPPFMSKNNDGGTEDSEAGALTAAAAT